MILASPAQAALLGRLTISWNPVGCGWLISSKLRGEALRRALGALGSRTRAPAPSDLAIVDGIRVSPTTWLGRPGWLPAVTASTGCKLRLEPIGAPIGDLSLTGAPPRWELASTAASDGRWRVVACEGGEEFGRVLVLEGRAPERRSWPPAPERFADRDDEMSVIPSDPIRSVPSVGTSRPPSAMVDLMEALYAGAPASGWPEGRLRDLLAPRLPHPALVWDVLRALSESGWTDVHRATGWGARVHSLREPSLLQYEDGSLRVEGAVGRRLMNASLGCCRSAAERSSRPPESLPGRLLW